MCDSMSCPIPICILHPKIYSQTPEREQRKNSLELAQCGKHTLASLHTINTLQTLIRYSILKLTYIVPTMLVDASELTLYLAPGIVKSSFLHPPPLQ